MRGIFLLVPLCFGFFGCAKQLMSPGKSPADNCQTRVEENASIPGVRPAKVLTGRQASGPYCYTELGMKARARQLACDSSFPFASLVNIQRPGFFNGSCYRADIEFYSTAQGVRISDEPIMVYDSVPSTGFQVTARVDVGGVLGGPQKRSGLVSEKGDAASTSKVGFSFGVRYYPLSFLGFEAETGGMYGSATAPNTKSMNFTNAWSSNFGLSLIPWQRLIIRARLQAVLSGGLNYTRLALSNDYKAFVEQNNPVVLTDDAATGLGWYAGGGLRILQKSGLLGEIGLRYSDEYPKFPLGDKAFSAQSLLLDLDLGYQF
jgi:hypothetical protein